MFRIHNILIAFALILTPIGTQAADSELVTEMLSQAQDFDNRRQVGASAQLYLQLISMSGSNGISRETLAESHYRMNKAPSKGLSTKESLGHLVNAADLGHPGAQSFLATIIIYQVHGKNSHKSIIEAMPRRFSVKDGVELLRASMAQGNVGAYTELAELYREGHAGLMQDPDYADQLEEKAYVILKSKADQNDPDAMDMLADFTKQGTGIPIDSKQSKIYEHMATRMYEDFADSGDIRAMRLVGQRYLRGRSPLIESVNIERAIYWKHRLVIENPMSFDVWWLASFYKDGRLPQNLVLAHALYNFSTTLGSPEFSASQRDEIAKELSKEQLSEALAIARTCAADGMADCLSMGL